MSLFSHFGPSSLALGSSSWCVQWKTWRAARSEVPRDELFILLEDFPSYIKFFVKQPRLVFLLTSGKQFFPHVRSHGKRVSLWPLYPCRGAGHPRILWEDCGGRPREWGGLRGPGQSPTSVRLPHGGAEAEGGPAAHRDPARRRAAGELEDRGRGGHSGRHSAHRQALPAAETQRGNPADRKPTLKSRSDPWGL